MSSIQDSLYPLVFPLASLPQGFRPTTPDGLRTSARALTGMQKEAVVAGASGPAWRMVCDEGPYLNGTDLAPFPLGFFCAGMASSYCAALLQLLQSQNIPFRKLKLLQDNRYSMEGSALAGTMRGSALPVQLQLVIDSPLRSSELQLLLETAMAHSPAAALLRSAQASAFSLQHNGTVLDLQTVKSINAASPPCPDGFDQLQPQSGWRADDALIYKLRSAEVLQGVSGGAGSSLTAEQKRVLHMQGDCSVRDDGLIEVVVELFQPLGSTFRFLVDPAGERAPAPMAYLSAGIAFCYLTQIGRYTAIRKLPLQDYRIVQDTCFSMPGPSREKADFAPVCTHVYLDSSQTDDYACQVLGMGEQTCFLHAACRQSVPVELQELSRAIPVVP
jgi:uncharacterized OsmC-like protein